MSVNKEPGAAFEAVTARHRLLVITGVAATLVGISIAAFVGYEWFVRRVSHEILAVVAAAALLVGVQVLVFSSLTSMLISLHGELLRQFED